jgi:subfamily B ATP-binding cassette protein MsbA
MFSLGSLKTLKPYIWPNRNWIYFSLAMALPLSALRAGPIPLVKYLVDEILVKKDPGKLTLIPIAIIALYLLNLFVRFFHYYAIRVVVVRTNQAVRERLYSHLISLSSDYYSENKSGVLLSRITADPGQLDNGIASVNVLIREPITFLALFSYALYTNWKLTTLTLTIVPALGFVFGKSGSYMKRKIAEFQVHNGETYSSIQEAISGIRVIHLFNLESDRLKKFRAQLDHMTLLLLKISKIEEIAGPSIELVTSFAIAIILYFGGRSVLNGEMSSGDLLAFFAAFGMMVNPIRQLTDINSKIHSAAAAMERINEFLSWKPRITSPDKGVQLSSIQTGIEFKSVGFAYPDAGERKILNEVSFSLPLGKSVALVGQSGSGKSSIVQLLTRMYDVTEGGIQVDGNDLRSLDLKRWRDLVAVVSQDVFLFHDTIFENIRMGKPSASKEEVIEAAKRAHAHEFIQRLPEGFETIVGDRGVKLSGGERQRISIARAFLKNSPCLILDEATSNLDNESEKIVQESLERLMQNRTTLVIAHRLSTIRNADLIVVLKQGKILETGTYQSLVEKGGEFQRLLSFSQSPS